MCFVSHHRHIREADYFNYFCSLLLPDRSRTPSQTLSARDAVCALHAFNIETARVRDLVKDPALGVLRLRWWLEMIDSKVLSLSTR